MARIQKKCIGVMPLFELVERDNTGARILNRLPFGRLLEKVESTIHGDSPLGKSVKNERTSPSIIVVDPRRRRQ